MRDGIRGIGLGLGRFEKSGSPGRARTADLMINSHPLYQLSYRGVEVPYINYLARVSQDLSTYFFMLFNNLTGFGLCLLNPHKGRDAAGDLVASVGEKLFRFVVGAMPRVGDILNAIRIQHQRCRGA